MFWLNSAKAACFIETPQPLMANRLNHRRSIARCASRNKRPSVRDQRRRAVGAPLARESLWEPLAVPASGVTTSDDRCIA
jgi:hypothetical protein